MELADGGDLFDKIQPDEGVGEVVAHFYFRQLISAVTYMHSMGIAHRDLKPENVLLSEKGDLKLADFGLAALFKKGDEKRLCYTICGSPPYIAPEVVHGRRSKRPDVLDAGYAGNVADIWSCGVVLFVLLVGNTPWDEPRVSGSVEYADYVKHGVNTPDDLWQGLPPSMLDLIVGMLTIDPTKRWSLQDIQAHPWFSKRSRFADSKGGCANPIGLATQMLSQLRIDFNKAPSQSRRDSSMAVEDEDAMDVDSSPRRSSANPNNINRISQTPEDLNTPTAETPFDWERDPRLPIPASQIVKDSQSSMPPPMSQYSQHNGAPRLSQLPPSTQDILSQDPALSQFSQNPDALDRMTLTQAARTFKDLMPNYSMSRFISPLTISQLIPLIVEALHRLTVPIALPEENEITQWERNGEASIRIKMADSRRQALSGHIVVEWMRVADQYVSEVRFVKASGDPLEWRRFFRNVILCVGERVVMRPDE